jgi:hypothetical protein
MLARIRRFATADMFLVGEWYAGMMFKSLLHLSTRYLFPKIWPKLGWFLASFAALCKGRCRTHDRQSNLSQASPSKECYVCNLGIDVAQILLAR